MFCHLCIIVELFWELASGFVSLRLLFMQNILTTYPYWNITETLTPKTFVIEKSIFYVASVRLQSKTTSLCISSKKHVGQSRGAPHLPFPKLKAFQDISRRMQGNNIILPASRSYSPRCCVALFHTFLAPGGWNSVHGHELSPSQKISRKGYPQGTRLLALWRNTLEGNNVPVEQHA